LASAECNLERIGSRIYPPGALVERSQLSERAILPECAGPPRARCGATIAGSICGSCGVTTGLSAYGWRSPALIGESSATSIVMARTGKATTQTAVIHNLGNIEVMILDDARPGVLEEAS